MMNLRHTRVSGFRDSGLPRSDLSLAAVFDGRNSNADAIAPRTEVPETGDSVGTKSKMYNEFSIPVL